MTASAEQNGWRIVGNPVFIAGFAYGSHYPSLVVNVVGYVLSPEAREALSQRLRQWAPYDLPNEQFFPDVPTDHSWEASIVWLLNAVRYLQCAAGLGVYERGRLLTKVTSKAGQATCCLPVSARVGTKTRPVFEGLFDFIAQAHEHPVALDMPERLVNAMHGLRERRSLKSNVTRFMRAAFQEGIPFQELPGELVQYGVGRCGYWLDSSFTEQTSYLGTSMARNKPIAAQMLRRAGLPVPPHRLVTNLQAAQEAAMHLGYPVVVKPANLDGGIGVATDLQSPEEVQNAFRQASESSPQILVEKHVLGRDYRLVVFRDEVIAAIERIPGGVTGNGQHTIRELVEQQNADPRRADGPHTVLKRVFLDEEAMLLLKRQGYDGLSVPNEGVFVRLRRAANIALGGMPVSVLDRVHPDNLRLAVRAARALRLDFAGVDLLMPDIAESWQRTGANICEVNAQPNLGQITTSHLYAPILRTLVSGHGRIPTALVLGADPQNDLARRFVTALQACGVVAGCHDTHGVSVGDDLLIPGRVSSFVGGSVLAAERDVGAMVVSVDDITPLQTGLPFARYDVLVIAGRHFRGFDGVDPREQQQCVQQLITCILPACDGRIVTMQGAGLKVPGMQRATRAHWDDVPLAPEQLVEQVVAAMLTIGTKYRNSSG